MMHSGRLILLAVILFATAHANAKDVTDSTCGCQLTVPESWNASKADAGTGASAYTAGNADQTEGASLYIVSNGNSENEKADFLKGFEDSVTEHGATVAGRSKEKIGGVDFIVLTISQATGGPKYSTAYIGFAEHKAFQIGVYSQTTDPSKDPVLKSVVSSFKIAKT